MWLLEAGHPNYAAFERHCLACRHSTRSLASVPLSPCGPTVGLVLHTAGLLTYSTCGSIERPNYLLTVSGA